MILRDTRVITTQATAHLTLILVHIDSGLFIVEIHNCYKKKRLQTVVCAFVYHLLPPLEEDDDDANMFVLRYPDVDVEDEPPAPAPPPPPCEVAPVYEPCA